MRAVIQRTSEASVQVEEKVVGEIGTGLLVLLGIEEGDTVEDVQWLCKKIVNMRIFADDENYMNRSLIDINGQLLLISQFTLHASTKKGNRPSFIRAARPDEAIPLYEQCIKELETQLDDNVEKGIFGANMKISLVNDGPVTIIIDSKNRE